MRILYDVRLSITDRNLTKTALFNLHVILLYYFELIKKEGRKKEGLVHYTERLTVWTFTAAYRETRTAAVYNAECRTDRQ